MDKTRIKLDFLAWRPLRILANLAAFPVALQAVALAVIIWLAYQGLETLHRITNHTLTAPSGLIGLPVIGWIMLVLALLVGWRSLRSLSQVPSKFLPAARTSLITTSILFATILTVWVWPVS